MDVLGGSRAAEHVIKSASGGTHPYLAARVDVDRVHRIVGEARRITVIAPIVIEAPARAFQEIQTAAGGADPQIPQRILRNGAGARIAQ